MRLVAYAAAFVLMIAAAPDALGQAGRFEFYNDFDPDRPTVIAAHGWLGSVSYNDTFARSPSYEDRANVIGWEWEAVFFNNLTGRARRSGDLLAAAWRDFIVAEYPDYDHPVQLAGHSLGTHVVSRAAVTLREFAAQDPGGGLAYQVQQVTLVDGAPEPEELQAAIDLVLADPLLPLKLDNYWSPPSADGLGAAYEGDLANVRVPLDHGDIWFWYWASLDVPPSGSIKPGGVYSVVGPYAGVNLGAATAWMVAGSDTPLDLTDDVFRGRLGNAPLASGEASAAFPAEVALTAWPNPAQGAATLSFTLVAASEVRLALYDGLGREVAVLVDGGREAGRHEVTLDGSRLPSGTYLVRLEAEGVVQTQRVTLVR